MSVQSIDLNPSEEAYGSNQDSLRPFDDKIKMTPILARTLEQTFERRSEEVTQPSSEVPNISEDEKDTVPPTTVVSTSTTKNPTKIVTPPPKKR